MATVDAARSLRNYLTGRDLWPLCAVAATYIILTSVAFIFVNGPAQFYFTDYWEHLATINEVARNGLNVSHPIYAIAAPYKGFTPLSIGLGLLCKATGMSAEAALSVGAIATSVIFIVGVADFAKIYFRDSLAAAILIFVLLCLWGIPPLIWTGFYSFRAQLHGNYYPGGFAFALTFVIWAQAIRVLRRPRIPILSLLAVIVMTALVIIVHQLSALFTGFGIGLFALFESAPVKRRAALMLSLSVAGLLTFAWPYFTPLALLSEGVAVGRETFNNYPMFFRGRFLVSQLWPALIGVPIAAYYAMRRENLALVSALALVSSAFVVGGRFDVSASHRFLPYAALFLHLLITAAVIDLLCNRFAIGKGTRSAAIVVMGVLAGVLAIGQLTLAFAELWHPWFWTHYPRKAQPVEAIMRSMQPIFEPGSVAIAYDDAGLVLPAFGCKVVAIPRPIFFVNDDAERQALTHRFFSPGILPEERHRIANRWNATLAVYMTSDVPDAVGQDIKTLGRVVFDRDGWVVVRLYEAARGSLQTPDTGSNAQ